MGGRVLKSRRIAGGPAGNKIVAWVMVWAAVVGAPASTAWAQSTPPGEQAPAAASAPVSPADLAAAKKHYTEGEKRYKAGDFAAALAEFRAANDIKGTPQAERYLGMSEDGLGHYTSAVEWFDKFLAHVPDKLASQGDEIRKREAEIKAMPGKVHIESTPAGAEIAVDEKPMAAPAPLDTELAPGLHKIHFSAKGHVTVDKIVDVAFASSQTVSVELEVEPPPPAPPPPAAVVPPPATPVTPPPAPAEPRSKLPAFITGGLAIAAAGVGTAFGIIALNDKSSFDKNPTTGTADNGDTHSLIADMAFGVAVTFGVTSVVLFLTNDEPAQATSSTHPKTTLAKAARPRQSIKIVPTPFVGPHGGGAGFSMQF
jgi:hypothetical protein